MIIRIDDICGNTDIYCLNSMIDVIQSHLEKGDSLWLSMSPLCSTKAEGQRVFPKIWKAYSNHKVFYEMDRVALGFVTAKNVVIANHGLLHVDHRLLGREGQELSIVTAAHLTDSKIFVPPFHKWNLDTELICKEHGIFLVKFEDGWKHIMFNPFEKGEDALYYFHPFDITLEGLTSWFNK